MKIKMMMLLACLIGIYVNYVPLVFANEIKVIRKAKMSGSIFKSWKEKDESGNFIDKTTKICDFENNEVPVSEDPEVSPVSCKTTLKSGDIVDINVYSVILLQSYPDFASIPVGEIFNDEDHQFNLIPHKIFIAGYFILSPKIINEQGTFDYLQKASAINLTQDLNLKSVQLMLDSSQNSTTEDNFFIILNIED